MDDRDPVPLGAAQGAQDTKPRRERGFLGRIAQVFGGNDNQMDGDGNRGAPRAANGALPAQSHGILNLRRMRVEDVAIPKAEIVAVSLDIGKDDLVRIFRESGMTRLPVYKGTLDSPVGLIHLKDFALSHGFNNRTTRFNLRKMVRPLLFAPPSMPLGVLLQKMQNERMHMALVIDEYGGVDGLVTIEDLIETVVGEIEDEHDIEDGVLWVEEAPGVFLAQAVAPVDEFGAAIGRDLPGPQIDEEIDTLGGLVFYLAGHVPARGEVLFHPDGIEFEVVDADPRRIKRLRVRLKPLVRGVQKAQKEPARPSQRNAPAANG